MIVLGVILYNLSIRRTWETYKSYHKNKSHAALAISAPYEIEKYRRQLSTLQHSSIQPYKREHLLERLTAFCRDHDLLIKSFPEAILLSEGVYQVITNQFELEGSYSDMVQLVYLLEEKEKLGNISSIKFYLYKDKIKKKELLRSHIILRNLKEQQS